jgi:hypothetical protein
MSENTSVSSVPNVPKVEGIKVVYMFGQGLTVCECGNAHQQKFCRYFKKYSDIVMIDGKRRNVKKEDVFIICNLCNRTRPIKEHIEDYNKVMKQHTK